MIKELDNMPAGVRDEAIDWVARPNDD